MAAVLLTENRSLVPRNAPGPTSTYSTCTPFRIVCEDCSTDHRRSTNWNPVNPNNSTNLHSLPLGNFTGDVGMRLTYPDGVTAGAVTVRAYGLIPVNLDDPGSKFISATTDASPLALDFTDKSAGGAQYQYVELVDRAASSFETVMTIGTDESWRDTENASGGDQVWTKEIVLDASGCHHAIFLSYLSTSLTGTGTVKLEARTLSKS